MANAAILCVDDESTILSTLKDQISSYFGDQYIYESAEGAEEAWEVIEELDADGIHILLIISDWLMPGIKGDEFLIDVHRRYPKVVKIILTGQADARSLERARQKAALHGCLHKPWDENELMALIQTGLEKR